VRVGAFARVACVGATLALSACTAMVQTRHAEGAHLHEVPADRLLAFQDQAPGTARVEVTRDAGFMGGGCYLALMYGGKLIGRFDPEEHATFWLPVGKVDLAAAPDPLGRGLCSISTSDPAIEPHEIAAGKTTYLRMRLGAYRRPWVVEDKAPVVP
jgi:hypothetical protein